MGMKLIIGANGRIGREVVANLLTAADDGVRVLVRDAGAAAARFGERVEVMSGDLDQPETVVAAMNDVDAVLLCSPVHPQQVRQHNGVIDAAKRNGKPYVVKISGLATYPGSFVDSGRWHAETEHYLASSGLPYTCLHPYFFMQNLTFQLPLVLKSGQLRSAVAQAAIAMVDVGDIAQAAGRLLADPALAPGQTLPLTSAEALSYPRMAQIMSDVLGRNVAYQQQSLQQVEQNLKKAGQPDWHVKLVLQFNRAFNEGLASEAHPALSRLLNRPPTTFAEFVQRMEFSELDRNPFPSE